MPSQEPRINFEDGNGTRYVTVIFYETGGEFASIRMIDPANPDETNAAERQRVIGIAKSKLGDISRS